MSTEYITNLKYNDLLKTKQLDISEPTDKVLGPTHVVLSKDGTYLHVMEDEDGDAHLYRWGVNRVVKKIFPIIVEEFGCTIIDEYGLLYPDCME